MTDLYFKMKIIAWAAKVPLVIIHRGLLPDRVYHRQTTVKSAAAVLCKF